MAMYGMAHIAGLDGGGFMADLVLVPFADAMLVPLPTGIDPVAVASMSDNIPDGWRTVGPYREQLAALEPAIAESSSPGGLSIGLYAAAFGVGPRRARRLRRHRPASAWPSPRSSARLSTTGTKPDRSWDPYPVTVHTTAEPDVLSATLRATWPDGVCTDTGLFLAPVELPLLAMYTRGVRFVTGRVNARAVIPEILELLSAGCDLGPVVDRVVPWEDADCGLADDDRQDGVQARG